ncbi:MAG: trypsin-like peptidase domain-containing protein, partial [Planctomycetota bacterium]
MVRRLPGRMALVAFLALGLFAGRSAADVPDVADLARRASASVVRVRAALPARETSFRLAGEEGVFWNTGFFVDSRGRVLTSLFALAGCADVTVLDAQGRRAPAEVFAVDQPSGLALLETGLAETVPLEFVGDLAPARQRFGPPAGRGGPAHWRGARR